MTRPTPGQVEERAAPTGAPTVDGRRLHGVIPYSTPSKDLGGFTEIVDPGALDGADLSNLICTREHDRARLLGRHPTTLTAEDRSDGFAWSVELPDSPAGEDVRVAVERGDLRSTSWRMVVAPGGERWEGDTRHITKIAELLDVCVTAAPAYAAAAAELRSQPNNPAEAEEDTAMADEAEQDTTTTTTAEAVTENAEDRSEATTSSTGTLRVEDRTAGAPSEATIDGRIVDAIRDVKAGEARALTTAVSVSPGELSTRLFDKLRSTSVVLSSGAVTVLTTDSDSVTYPTVTVDTAPTNYAEAAAITPGDPTLATVVAVPQKIAHLVQLSNEVIDDSDPSIVQVVSDNLLRATAVKLDQQLFEGSGTPPQMTGMHLAAGVQTMASAAIMANFDWASDALALLEGVGGEPAAWFMSSRTYAQIRKLKKGTGDVTPVMGADRGGPSQASPQTLFGVPMFHSNQVSITDAPGTATAVHLVAQGALVYVNRQSPVVEVDRSRLFNSDQSEIRVKLRGNLIAAIPNAIVRVTGMLPG